ncbi:hypothetical protein [Lysinibacillus sp. NPDC056232]|uniref:hypothetical protein n=1 Tax=Lysinibacillus sp. NPDC056232 TaxID=3345756 RepID=UPI0035D62CB2
MWLISVPTGRFVADASLQGLGPNTMLVTKALSQVVMVLAFVPLSLIPKESPKFRSNQLIYIVDVLTKVIHNF